VADVFTREGGVARTVNADIDRDWLARWIQPQHLDAAGVEMYRHSFASHPVRLVWMRNFLQPDIAERLSRFLRTEAEFSLEYGVYSSEEAVGRERWEAAAPDDRFFRFSKVKGTAPAFRMSRNALTYIQFRQAFQKPSFREFFEAVTGLPLVSHDDFGSHSMIEGDFLRAHSDNNRNRQLAIVVYLSPGWDAAWGGALHVVDRHGVETIIAPEHNSVVAFDVLTDSEHYVTPITSAAGSQQRLTIGGWYHRADNT
jgi:hypothetical protein